MSEGKFMDKSKQINELVVSMVILLIMPLLNSIKHVKYINFLTHFLKCYIL